MFTPNQTGQASPQPDSQKTICGSCAACQVRLNSSADPRLLPCLHTVCDVCYTHICTDGATQVCPLCAHPFSLSEVTECDIFEDDSSKNNKVLKCAGCEESEVTGWCVQCEEALCLDCTSAHRRVKVTRDHEVTPKKPPEGWTQRRRCPLHTQESLKFFCLVCEELTCKDCQLITHRGHSFVQQEEAVESQRTHLQSLLDSIRLQKEMLSRNLMLLEARLQDIEEIKAATKKILLQVFHTLYQALVRKWAQIFVEIHALYAEEVKHLLERKTSLNRLEECQDYISSFIDKVLSTEGHCLLVRTKRIETQVKMLLSQETSTPETMTTLHVQIQKHLYDHIIKIGFMKITKYTVPFSSQRASSTQSESVPIENSNPKSVQITTTDVSSAPDSFEIDKHVPGEYDLNHPALHPCGSSQMQMNQSLPHSSQPSQLSHSNQVTTQSSSQHVASYHLNQSTPSSDPQCSYSSAPSAQNQSHDIISGQSKHSYNPSSNNVPYSSPHVPKPYTNPSPSVYAQPNPSLTKHKASQINKNSKTANRKKTWTYHYYPTMQQVSQARQKPLCYKIQRMPANNQTTSPTNTIPAHKQMPAVTHPIPADTQTPVQSHSVPSNRQAPIQTPMLVNNPTSIPAHPVPANNQTSFLAHPIPVNNQTPAPSPYPVPDNNQMPEVTHPIPADTQTPVQNHSVPSNSQAPILTPMAVNNLTSIPTHPVPANNQTPFLAYPIPANNQTPVQTHLIPTSSQTCELIKSIPINNQTSIIIQPIQSSIQTPVAHAILVNDQTPLLTHPITANDQTAVLAQQIPSSNQMCIVTHAIPVNNQSLILSHLIPDKNQTPVLTQQLLTQNQSPVLSPQITDNNQYPRLNHPIQVNNQTSIQTHPMPVNNPTPVLTHPASAMPSDTQRLILTNPLLTSVLGLNPTIPNLAGGPSLHPSPMHSAPISGNDSLWSKRDIHNNANLAVKALADSACDQDAGVSSSNFTDGDQSDSNMPTSTMSETDPKESNPADSMIASEKCFRQAEAGQSSPKSDSGPKHWSACITTPFCELVETPYSSIDNLKTTSSADSTPCSTSDDLAWERMTHDKTVQSCFHHSKTKEEEIDSAVTLEHFKTQLKQLKRSLSVSLVRLPVTVPSCGQPLPEFHLSTDTSTDYILVQESQEGQIKQVWRWADIPVSSGASSCTTQDSDMDSSPASDVYFCALCESAGAALLCMKCGCAFHFDCHIPPVLTKPREDWVCLLCQDLNETVVYDSEDMRTSSLSLQDQRKCEKLLLGLLCDENKCLLYSATKNHSKTPEFDIILGRLLGKRKPPYRTAAELVSDVWTLFDMLMINLKERDVVVRIKKSFQQRLHESFGNSLHASLLKLSDPEGTSDTEAQKEKHRNTLKRMREFFIANCGTTAKKSCSEKVTERKENPTAGEN